MEKITMTKFLKLSDDDQLEMEGTIANGNFKGIIEHNGIKWIQIENIDTGENILVSEELEKKLEEIVFEQIKQDLKESPKKDFMRSFRYIAERFYMSEYVDDVMKNIPKNIIVLVYTQYSKKLTENKIDIFKYIEPEELYDEISKYIAYMDSVNEEAGKDEYSESFIEKYQIARDMCREELDKRIEQSGGISNWINEKNNSKSKSKNFFAKTILLEEIIDRNLSEEENEKYANLLIKVGTTAQEIAIMIEGGHLPLEAIAKMNTAQPLKKLITESVARLDITNTMRVFLATSDVELLDNANWRQVTPMKLRDAIEPNPELKATIAALFMIKMYKQTNKKFSEQEIDMIFESKNYDRADILRAYFELAKEGLYNDDKVMEVYQDVTLNEYEEIHGERVSIPRVSTGEMLSLYTPDRVIEKLSGYDNVLDDNQQIQKMRFMAYYTRIIKSHGEVYKGEIEKILDELQMKLQEGINNGESEKLGVAIDLNKFEIITDDMLRKIITLENEDMIFDLYEKGLDDNILLKLYRSNIITENVISLIYEDQLSDKRLQEKIENKKISKENIVILLFNGIIDEKELKGINFEGLNWKNIFRQTGEKDLVNKIASLYTNEIIGFEEVKILKEQEIISAKDAELILNQLDLDAILIKGLTSEEGVGEKRNSTKRGESKRKEGIALEDRDELLNSLGFEAVKNSRGETLVVAEGSFKGYRVYRDKDKAFRVIVFEGLKDGSSFIMHEAKAGEFIRTEDNEASLIGSRSQWREKARTSGSVTAKLHTNQWGNNIIQAIVDTSSTFKFDDEKDRRDFVKQETKRLQEENRDLVEYISLIKKEEKAR